MRRYETLFILRSDQGESQIKDTIRRFEGIITAGGGDVIEADEWGSRELAYRIKGEHRGYYVRLDYAASSAVMNEVERNLKLQDSVLRYLSVLLDAEADVAKAREDVETKKRKAAEARAQAEARAAAYAQSHAAPEHAEVGGMGLEETGEHEVAEDATEPEGGRQPD